MTIEQYIQFVRQDQKRCDEAFFNGDTIPIPWQQLVYETLDDDLEEHPNIFWFNKRQRQSWTYVEKSQGCLNTFRDQNVMIVNYLVWYGKIYVPSFRCDLNRLPQLDSSSMHEALSLGYLTMIAGNYQRYVVDVIKRVSEEYSKDLGKIKLADYDFRNQIGKTLWKNRIHKGE